MKTNQIMESQDRELYGMLVRQRTKDGFLDLVCIENICSKFRWENGMPPLRLENVLRTKEFILFIEELKKDYGGEVYFGTRKNRNGWVHPFLGLKILTHSNPKFEVQVYKWLFDYLIQNRIDSGDSYKRMCGTLYQYTTRRSEFHQNIQKMAQFIKKECGVDDWNKASQEQLRHRDKLQDNIAGMVSTLKDTEQGVKLGVFLTREQIKNQKN